MGNKRSFKTYMEMVGIDVNTKKISQNLWCIKGEWPKQAMRYKLNTK